MSHLLDTLISGLENVEVFGRKDRVVKGIALDSRRVENGGLFAALKGDVVDGHDYIDRAIAVGAEVLLVEQLSSGYDSSLTWIVAADVRKVLGEVASRFYDKPTDKMKVIGVTGTNGKTTVASLLYGLFKELGYKVGLVSTIEILIDDRHVDTRLTTPDVVSLHGVFADMVDAGCDFAFMEVSSHAVVQDRIAGVSFAAGVFTNISHDHLDYHGTFKEYVAAKRGFFDQLSSDSFAITNVDDKNGEVMVQNTKAQIVRCSLRQLVDYKAKVLAADGFGMQLSFNEAQFMTRLVGDFNAYNLLAVYAVADLMQVADDGVLIEALSKAGAVKGRLEIVSSAPRVIVDYAHTPDALDNVLSTLESLRNGGRIITVVGCGGDRDAAKRPVMAKVAVRYSDQCIFTADNPRSEDPDDIIKEMVAGLSDRSQVLEIVDRKMAIKTAIALARKNDIILIAGKGHEEYQEIKGERRFFSDQQIVRDILSEDI